MRLYKLSCERCGWKAPIPVDEQVAARFKRMDCRDCLYHDKVRIRFTVKEVIAVGPVQFLPHKEPKHGT